MKVLKVIITLLIVVVVQANATAQTTHPLIGAWGVAYEEDGEKIYLTNEFRKEKGELICYTTYIKDAKGNGEKYEAVVMQNIKFEDKNGKGDYKFTYEDKEYEVKAELQLTNYDTLIVSYSKWGYSDTETWKRLK
ncbi:hypothetical protein [Seonamhaeicola sp.]|uniref:hypothetical protein n=1 Tax=Seonamhaeicola sp. TaxID=1912245 RepID=UPI00260B94AE|nr:hypothetical protein [Seonamhaeicola sp.]